MQGTVTRTRTQNLPAGFGGRLATGRRVRSLASMSTPFPVGHRRAHIAATL